MQKGSGWRVKHEGRVMKKSQCSFRTGSKGVRKCSHPKNSGRCLFDFCPLPKKKIVAKQTTLPGLASVEVDRIHGN